MNEPLISIVLTTYNRRSILPRAVDSVLNGSYSNFEMLILDDASTDGTREYCESLTDPRIRYLRQAQNGGVLRSRNRGFAEAKGEIVAILDDDDELTPDALPTVVEEFGKTAAQGVEVIWFDCMDAESGRPSGAMSFMEGPLRFEDYLCGKINGDFWTVFRREAIIGYRFDERLKAHESLLWLRIHRKHKAWYVPKMLCRKYRQHGLERLSDVDVRVRQLPHTTLAMSEFIKEFGTELASISPALYGSKLAYLGLHQMATGKFSAGRRSVLSSLRYRFSVKYVGLYLASCFLGVGTLTKLIHRIETEASSQA
jgi:glycosyltransferase involved in cell wall biosynthesis